MLMLLACAEWPRFSQWPEADASASEVGDQAPEFAWTEVAAQADVNESPHNLGVETLTVGHGTRVVTSWVGTGWDDTLTADYAGADEVTDTESCSEVSDFPPVSAGDWTGDVDWRVLDVGAGFLCSALAAKNPEVGADVLAYAMDGCDVPFEAVRVGSAGLGWRGGADVVWSTEIAAPMRIGVVSAAWTPVGDSTEIYAWGIALVERPEDCPALPVSP